jgi:hypothetical protein
MVLGQASNRTIRHGGRGRRIEPQQASKRWSLNMAGRGHPDEEEHLRANTPAFGNGDNDALPGLIGLRMGNG